MSGLNSDESMRCPKCKNISVSLIPINDNGTGQKVCRTCKFKILNRMESKMAKKDEKKVEKKEIPKAPAKPIKELSDKTAWVALSIKRLEQIGFDENSTTKEVREFVFNKLGIK